MSKLIAMVATAVVIEGVRTVIQPGEALPEISKHDERELLQSGAAQHTADQAALDKADAAAVAAAEAEFAEARKRAQDEDRSRQQANAEAKVADAETKAEADAKAAADAQAEADAKAAAGAKSKAATKAPSKITGVQHNGIAKQHRPPVRQTARRHYRGHGRAGCLPLRSL